MKTGLSYMIATAGSKPEKVEYYELPGKKANSRFKEMTEGKEMTIHTYSCIYTYTLKYSSLLIYNCIYVQSIRMICL